MKKVLFVAVILAGSILNAAAYFDGGATATTGPDAYRGNRLNLVIGSGNVALEPSLATYTSDLLDHTYRTYALRGAWEADLYTIGAEAGETPKVNDYSNKFAGGDITISLTPGEGGKSRLAGPGSRGTTRGGTGMTRLDVGAGLRQTQHEFTGGAVHDKTDQTEYSLFAGAKILMLNLSASYTGYNYGARKVVPLINPIPGHNFAYGATPKSSVNTRLDIPGTPIVTPFVAYTGTKYKDSTHDSYAYLFGAYIDLSMIVANVAYQIFDKGSARVGFITVGAGIKF
jgi:hypothetical protein